MVEGIITLSFLVLFFAVCIFFYTKYAARQVSFAKATATAFRDASAGCGTPFGNSYDINHLLTTPPPDPLDLTPDDSYLGAMANGTKTNVSYSGVAPVVLGGASWTIGTQADVMCNEPPMTQAEALKAMGFVDWAVNGVLAAGGF